MSSGFLLDTSVLSHLVPGRAPRGDALVEWLRSHAEQLYISTITICEIEQGICKLRRTGASQRADALAHWITLVLGHAQNRVLALDAEAAQVTGRLADHAIAIGRHPGFADVAIAATATTHNLLILTCNGNQFAPLGVAFVDPTQDLPHDLGA